MKFCWILLSHVIFEGFASASPRISPQIRQREPSIPQITPFSPSPTSDPYDELRKRQTTTQISTCGYDNGDPTKPRTANSGFDCRVDTKNGLWGFCPTTVIAASDCGLAGFCVDGSDCSGGCGLLGVSSITTFTCNSAGGDFCSTALLIDGPDQTYSYIACAPNAGTEVLLAEPNLTSAAAASSTTSSSPSKAKASSTSTPSASSSTSASSSSTSSASISSQSGSTASSSSQSAIPASASNTNTSNSSSGSKSNVGPIVGGVLGGLALIGFFVLAALFLMRKYHRNQASTEVMPQQPMQEGGRDDPKILAGRDMDHRRSSYRQYGGYGPSELSTRQEPAELGS